MPPTLTRTQVCRTLNISPKTLYLWEKSGKIPAPARDSRGWRVYSPEQIEAIRQQQGYLSPLKDDPVAPSADSVERLSARNQLRGVVLSIRGDGVLCEVVLQLGDGQEVVSVVTQSSVERLGIRIGEPATAIIKSTEVMLFR